MDSASALRALGCNLEALRGRIEAARTRSPRAAPSVAIVVVSKAAPEGGLPLLPACGVRDVGENRVQAALAKRPGAPRSLVWHGIGHLQRNKAAKAITVFDVFHALDSPRLADELEAALARGPEGRTWPVYLQVNTARDPAKGGVPPEDALAFWRLVGDHPRLQAVGFMTMAPEKVSEPEVRAAFRTLREIRDDAARSGAGRVPPSGLPMGLSMGMSDDFEVAVEEGATVVRLGRSVWGGIASPVEPANAGRSD